MHAKFGRGPTVVSKKGSLKFISRLHCIALHCGALHCLALHCLALPCLALHCAALRCVAFHCIALHCIALHCTALHCTALHCIVLYCIVLYCFVLYNIRIHDRQKVSPENGPKRPIVERHFPLPIILVSSQGDSPGSEFVLTPKTYPHNTQREKPADSP